MQMYIVTLVSFFALFFPQETTALIASPAARAIVPLSQPTLRSLPHRVDICGNTPRWRALPRILFEYHDLRASTTISLTETAITSGAGPGLETVAAVVFAGGIACHRHKSLKAPEKMTIAVKIKARSLIATMAVATTPGGYVRAETGRTDPAKNKTAQRIKPLVAPPKTAMAMTPACNAPPKCCPEKLPKCPADDFKSDEEKDEDMCKADKFKGRPCKNPDFESMDVNIHETFPATNNAAALGTQAAISLQKL
ncbi:hypothetical protein SNOG_14915 [Parastagonospora nodorum SN15]|uniref:Uncharacterized protein n=1 Tax=Phaeosphaeria nodorum (strain SN15 / ATCC MYA-4574 / FGSC 10173) TaxID=321614 RepID=Q0U066_PHANO|nr:hypothetical protein SNOG_14915 [Parastagonospora nodorum SN15]EAT77767.1 hypothetical protein SNOG_14915 [Parastagonospora nodorum SN15]